MQNQIEQISCNICGVNIISRCLAIHQKACARKTNRLNKSKMISQIIPCSECGQNVLFQNYSNHLQQCVGRQLQKCPNCKILYPIFLFQEHMSLCNTFNSEQEQIFQLQQQQFQNEEDFDFDFRNMIMQLAQQHEIKDQPLSIQVISKMKKNISKKQQQCSICYCFISKGSQVFKLTCPHLYHEKCLTAWLQKNPHCPMCRNHVLT